MDNIEDVLNIVEYKGEPRVKSTTISEQLGIEHRGLIQTIKKYEAEISAFGGVTFEMDTLPTKGGVQQVQVCYLNEDQSILVGTLSRNTEKVIKFKMVLVRSFSNFKKNKTQLAKQTPSYQIDNPVERAKAWIAEYEAYSLKVKQKDESILALATDVQATRETLAKNYKTVNARNKADLGNAINLLVNKHFNRNGDNYARAHKDSWEAFYQATGVRYYGASNSTYEQKLTFLNFLTTL